ncbi:DNA-3-methyladenine glycosylase family protein [Thermobrachium celere]|uniref:DNA-(apurinic or apyrimidinic site) lyase n=1 Tax=Thermobrachium celere DSM 8682 TaxID=941824 RepID=R7RRT4_9CLOT|nr:DNA-3-methyladenine glycosylase [Thermobrachium celere]CDF58774.1 8-oxoguanine-DNA-glycosylase [Thermobrachium celere DSM 8682]
MYKFQEYSEGIVIRDTEDFDIKQTFDCGQCFRWNEDNDGSYVGVAHGRAVRIIQDRNDIYIKGGKIEDKYFWEDYFDLKRDYKNIKKELSKDKILKEAIQYGEGIRILNQDMFEIIVSFIISANNRIPMIKRAVENISRRYGEEIEFEGRKFYAFPNAERLKDAKVEELEACGTGFRAPYIVDTVSKIYKGEVDLNHIKSLNTDDAHKELIKLKGIGPKVADCILLFSMQKYDAFPVDVWVKRVMQHFYLAPDVSLNKIRQFGRDKFKELAGFAQQYLFYYAREFKGKDAF